MAEGLEVLNGCGVAPGRTVFVDHAQSLLEQGASDLRRATGNHSEEVLLNGEGVVQALAHGVEGVRAAGLGADVGLGVLALLN